MNISSITHEKILSSRFLQNNSKNEKSEEEGEELKIAKRMRKPKKRKHIMDKGEKGGRELCCEKTADSQRGKTTKSVMLFVRSLRRLGPLGCLCRLITVLKYREE
ncbi:MAG: hypothetical protein IKP00_01335 [Victivallales bacterium]|nr:hypothetical protein [Victivallales bacterium]